MLDSIHPFLDSILSMETYILLLASVVTLGAIFYLTVVPETKDKTLHDITMMFVKKD